MSTRDARGRFVNADHAAAERVLEAACREAVAILRAGLFTPMRLGIKGRLVEADHRHLAAQTLAHAGYAAELLLSERAS